MAQQFLQHTDPEELPDLVNELLPLLLKSLAPEQRTAFLKSLITNHLAELLRGVNKDERAELMRDIMPIIVQEFPLDEIELLSVLINTSPHTQKDVEKDNVHRG